MSWTADSKGADSFSRKSEELHDWVGVCRPLKYTWESAQWSSSDHYQQSQTTKRAPPVDLLHWRRRNVVFAGLKNHLVERDKLHCFHLSQKHGNINFMVSIYNRISFLFIGQIPKSRSLITFTTSQLTCCWRDGNLFKIVFKASFHFTITCSIKCLHWWGTRKNVIYFWVIVSRPLSSQPESSLNIILRSLECSTTCTLSD